MKVYSLVGKSGTGKSFHAQEIKRKYDIDAIIDDGLFIYRNMVIEGTSAKKATTKIGAIKVAIFQDDRHKDAVANAIKDRNLNSILILATSDSMVDRIVERLDIDVEGEINRIRIEEITTPDERRIADIERHKYGKHVIPAPSLQLKQNFAGYFMDPLRIFRGRDVGAAAERTVVRPPFSYNGDYIIEERAIDDIVHCAARRIDGISKVVKISHYTNPENYGLDIAINMDMKHPIWKTASKFQKEVASKIEYMTAFNVSKVNIEVRGLV